MLSNVLRPEHRRGEGERKDEYHDRIAAVYRLVYFWFEGAAITACRRSYKRSLEDGKSD